MVIAVIDPTSRGDGGAAVLRAAGVDVEVGILAGEARLVLNPWLTAIKHSRPTVTAAYLAHAGAGTDEAIRGRALTELRTSVDAVLHPDGTVEEGVTGSHGQGVLNLPTTPVTGAPPDVLTELYTAGVRSLLLVGDAPLVKTYAGLGLVDRALAFLPQPDEPAEREPMWAGIRLPPASVSNA
ncbi:MAG TPA: hypothetical protein VGJ44_01070 [Kribbellaceae bacterium]